MSCFLCNLGVKQAGDVTFNLINIALLAWPLPGLAEYYKYRDENGVLRPSNALPEKYADSERLTGPAVVSLLCSTYGFPYSFKLFLLYFFNIKQAAIDSNLVLSKRLIHPADKIGNLHITQGLDHFEIILSLLV